MPEERGVVRRIVWREVCPWLLIFRSFRNSISLPVLVLATAGWLLTPLGPLVAGRLFGVTISADRTAWLPELHGATGWLEAQAETAPEGSSFLAAWPSSPVVHVYQRLLVEPCWGILTASGVRETAYHALVGFWHIAVWAFFGVAIIRIAAVQLGREERVELRQAIGFSVRRYGWSVAAPLFPLLGVLLTGGMIALLGLLMRTATGVVIAGLVWPLVLIGGIILTILLLGFLAGWPHMWPTIASEEHGDAFEAFSRSFSYVYQRPLQYVFYLVVAGLFGAVSWLLVSAFAEAVIRLPLYAASWGASSARITEITGGSATGATGWGAGLILLASQLVRLITVAFQFSFFFCVTTAIYLVLRRDVDQTDIDEVYVDEREESYSLPPLQPNPDGVPSVEDSASLTAPLSGDSTTSATAADADAD